MPLANIHKKDDDDDDEEDEQCESPLIVNEILLRVAKTYKAQWKTYTILTAICLFPMIRPMVRLQESIEYVLSDPIYLFHITATEGNIAQAQVQRVAEFFYRLYLEWKEFPRRAVLAYMILLPLLNLLSRQAITKNVLQQIQQQHGVIAAKDKKNTKKLTPPHKLKGIGVGMILFFGQVLAQTAVPVWLGPDPLHLGWVIGYPKVFTALFCFFSLCGVFYALAPFLLAYPMVIHEELPLVQALRKSWKLGQKDRFDIWFAHALLLYFQVSTGVVFRLLGSRRFDDDYGELACQHVQWLVYMPCFMILQTDLYLHCSGIISPAETEEEKPSSKSVWLAAEGSDTNRDPLGDSKSDIRARPAKEV